jgi:hypothetical protein
MVSRSCPRNCPFFVTKSFYSLVGTFRCSSCFALLARSASLAGSYSNVRGAIACNACPSGSFCAFSGLSAPTLCPAGTYNPNVLMTSLLACLTCPIGSFCSGGSSNPMACPYGVFGSMMGLSSANCRYLFQREFKKLRTILIVCLISMLLVAAVAIV